MKCTKCGNPIPSKRLELLPNTKNCVNCSTTDKLVGMPIAVGRGEEIYNELNIMTQENYKKLIRLQKGTFAESSE